MPGIDEANALSLWESSAHLSMLDRAVRLTAVIADISIDAAADMPISARDRLLLSALRRLGGETVPVVAACPACGTMHEADVELSPLLQARDRSLPKVKIGRRRAVVRPPSSRELAAAIASGDIDSLAGQCCDALNGRLDPAAAGAVEAALEEAFPLLNILIAMQCDACATGFAQRLDPVPLLWGQLAALARRAIADVDKIARVYGWSEREIFALSPARRRLYCDMVSR